MLPKNSLEFCQKYIKSSKIRLKLIQYFKDNIWPTVVLFLQETHYDSKVKQNWKEDFKCQVSFFFLQKDKLLWRFNCYCRMETFTVKNKKKIKKVVF